MLIPGRDDLTDVLTHDERNSDGPIDKKDDTVIDGLFFNDDHNDQCFVTDIQFCIQTDRSKQGIFT